MQIGASRVLQWIEGDKRVSDLTAGTLIEYELYTDELLGKTACALGLVLGVTWHELMSKSRVRVIRDDGRRSVVPIWQVRRILS